MALTWTENEIAFEHRGVAIYHVYPDNDASVSPWETWFSTSAYAADGDPTVFKIEDFPGELSDEELDEGNSAVFRAAIDELLARGRDSWLASYWPQGEPLPCG